MNDYKQSLDAAILAFNQAERAEFVLDTDTRWLGLDGPAYLLGDVRVRAFFVDVDGRHWVDACLAVESMARLVLPGTASLEGYRQLAVDVDAAHDLWVFTDTRGRWNAVMAPVDGLARRWGYPPPTRLPDGNWARNWLDLPERTDEQELAWIAHGGKPVHTYRAEAQL
jgi:hypothetical protein